MEHDSLIWVEIKRRWTEISCSRNLKSVLLTMAVNIFGTLRDVFHSLIVNTSAQMSDNLQRSAVRNAESIVFWTEFRRLLGALEEVCPGEK